jgi:hypothetical protein
LGTSLFRWSCILWLGIASPTCPAAGAEYIGGFEDSQTFNSVWDRCEAASPANPSLKSVTYGGDTREVVRFIVDPSTGNKEDKCPTRGVVAGLVSPVEQDPDRDALAGSSLVDPQHETQESVRACPPGEKVDQRNELRFWKASRPDLYQDPDDPHWYSLTFRVSGAIYHCGSGRWIIGQWKQERNGTSPFLAQRFDNGVLHITVQNGDCRCKVAQAPGDPDARLSLSVPWMIHSSPALEGVKQPLKCIDTKTEDETICTPSNLQVLTIGGQPPPALHDPSKEWVTMSYLVRDGNDGKGLVDIYDGNQFIARVTGLVGYDTREPGQVKFKIGHYRARMPGTAILDVDRVCVSKDVKTCMPGIEPFQ